MAQHQAFLNLFVLPNLTQERFDEHTEVILDALIHLRGFNSISWLEDHGITLENVPETIRDKYGLYTCHLKAVCAVEEKSPHWQLD